MKFTMPLPAFREAFASALAGASAGKLAHPLLSHVLCIAESDGRIVLHGTDNTKGVITTLLGARVDEPGRAVLHGAVVGSFLQVNDGDLTVRATASLVKFQADGGECRPPLLTAGEYPVNTTPERAILAAEVLADDLLTAVRRSAFAATDDVVEDKSGTVKTRGVLIQVAGTALRVAGMHANLAAITRCPATVHTPAEAMVTAATLGLIRKSIPKGGEPVRVKFLGDAQGVAAVVFETPRTTLWVSALSQKSPPVAKLIPAKGAVPLFRTTDAGPLFAANSRALVTISTESQRGKFRFDADGCEVTTGSPERGESAVQFTLPEYTGEPVSVDFLAPSVHQIGQGLKREDGTRAEVHRIGSGLRLVVRYGTDESGGLAVLMQMADAKTETPE